MKELDELEEMTRSRYAVDRRLGQYGEYLRRTLGELAARGTVRHSDGRMVLFELAGGDAAEPAARNITLHDSSTP